MKTLQKRNIAKVEVQKSFCGSCHQFIKKELQKIEHVDNVMLYPRNNIIEFSFYRANELAAVLNTLTKLGYPEIGETVSWQKCQGDGICNC